MTKKNYKLVAKESIQIKVKHEKAFLYFANLNNYSSWFPEVAQMKEVETSPISTINKAYEEKVLLDESGHSTFITVLVKEFMQNKRIITQAEFDPLFPQMTISCKEDSSSLTTIDFKFESRSMDETYLSSKDFKFIKELLQSRSTIALRNLKKILE